MRASHIVPPSDIETRPRLVTHQPRNGEREAGRVTGSNAPDDCLGDGSTTFDIDDENAIRYIYAAGRRIWKTDRRKEIIPLPIGTTADTNTHSLSSGLIAPCHARSKSIFFFFPFRYFLFLLIYFSRRPFDGNESNR